MSSDFRFHLVGKKAAIGESSTVIGTFVTGPASILLSGVLGDGGRAVPDAEPHKKRRQSSKSVKSTAKPRPRRSKGRSKDCGSTEP